MPNPRRSQFPADFRWGLSTSAFQVEGAANVDGRAASIWDTFCAEPGRIRGGATATQACEHYDRSDEDLSLIKTIGANAYRFSVSWPRILPNGRGTVNVAGLDFYDRLIDGLIERGIDPWLTLYHWDLPQALQDKGGWPNRDTAFAFEEFADAVSRRVGDRVRNWITHNEPWCSTIKGYFEGEFAPGLKDLGAAIQSTHHVLLSHGLAIPVLRQNVPQALCGIALSLHPIFAASESEADHAAMVRHDGIRNRWFLDPLYGSGYPEDILAELGASAPTIQSGDIDIISTPTDFLGVNYYFREFVADDAKELPVRTRVTETAAADRTGFNWEVYPEGLTDLLQRLERDYRPGPIVVTENGATYPDELDPEGAIKDSDRVSFIRRHIDALHLAMKGGVDVKGYFVWSLLDNFEWAEGYSKRFGLVHVDFQTQKRTMKDSAKWYSEFLRN
ncbi:beta-glucosidase [Rhizobium leguminosarum]|uniref:GH1 family beta-glucosidase n=1 Tax=Rhizobium leguminosarum TaxID=384 RepID=UPI001C95DD18|nr:GH1 family beta-glucosidase [Rhizobium leguminosarum]MBY5766974.1 beta-glucosidase [Rhizobium leguminosarum]